MAKYRKKPVVVEAAQWWRHGDHPEVVPHVDKDSYAICNCGKALTQHGKIKTLEGWHIVCPGDYIIKGIAGEFYPCKPGIFAKTTARWLSIMSSAVVSNLVLSLAMLLDTVLHNYLTGTDLPESDVLFLHWLAESGLPTIKKIIKKELPANDQLTAQVAYDQYILTEELTHYNKYPQDLRSLLVSIITDLTSFSDGAPDLT